MRGQSRLTCWRWERSAHKRGRWGLGIDTWHWPHTCTVIVHVCGSFRILKWQSARSRNLCTYYIELDNSVMDLVQNARLNAHSTSLIINRIMNKPCQCLWTSLLKTFYFNKWCIKALISITVKNLPSSVFKALQKSDSRECNIFELTERNSRMKYHPRLSTILNSASWIVKKRMIVSYYPNWIFPLICVTVTYYLWSAIMKVPWHVSGKHKLQLILEKLHIVVHVRDVVLNGLTTVMLLSNWVYVLLQHIHSKSITEQWAPFINIKLKNR